MYESSLRFNTMAPVMSTTRPALYSLVERQGNAYYVLKRALDLVLVVPALILLLPLFLLIALLIKLDSPGPVFFIQDRVGSRRRREKGRTVWELRIFPMFKFRSMYADADESLHQEHIKAFVSGALEAQGEEGAEFKLAHDPRVTRMGRFLRKTSLDELPQLINVLKGDMTLVGPRPVPVYEVAEYEPEHYERLAAVPGVTGLWQLKGRGQVTFQEMLELDLEYVHNHSLGMDMAILLGTIPAVLAGRGAG